MTDASEAPRPAGGPEPSPERSRLGARAWLVTIAAVLVLLAGSFISLPGVDAEALAGAVAYGQGGLLGLFGARAPAASLFALGTGLLLLVRAVVAAIMASSTGSRGVPWPLLGFVFFALASAAQAWFFAVTLEQLGATGFIEVVPRPGLAFRLLATLSMVAAAAVLWFLASLVTRSGVGHGPLVLFGAEELLRRASALVQWGEGVATHGGSLGPAAELAMAMPATLVLVGIFFRRPAFPVQVRGRVSLLSPVDLVVLPYAAAAAFGLPLSSAALLPGGAAELLSDVALVTTPVLAMGAAVALLVWLGRRPRAARAPWPALVLGLFAPFASLALLLFGFSSGGGLTRMLEPGPFEGEGSFRVVLRAEAGDGRRDGGTLLRRLDALGVRAEVQDARQGRLVLIVHGVRDGEEVVRAVAPRLHLALHPVAADQGPLTPALGEEPPHPGLVRGDDYGEGAVWMTDEPARLAPLLARASGLPGRVARVECRAQEPGMRECFARLLEAEPMVTGEDVVDAEVALDEWSDRPIVHVSFSDRGAERFAEGTRALVGRKLAIVLDEEILSSPVVQDAITGGRAQITLGASSDAATLHAQARALAGALRAGALSSPWEVADVERIR